MAGWFELNESSNGQVYFVLKAEDGHILLRSETYEAKLSAQNGIASVQANSALDDRYEKKEASDGRSFFNLKSANHQVIGTSQMYSASLDRENGIAAVKANGATTIIKEKV